MGYFHDPHRIDSPSYRTPAQRAAEPASNGHVPMTVGGLTEAQAAAARAQQAQAQSRAAVGNGLAQQVFELTEKVRDTHRAFNAGVHRECAEKKIEDPQVIHGMLSKFAESEAAQAIGTGELAIDAWVDRKAAEVQLIRDGLSQPGDAAAEIRRDRAWAADRLAIQRAQEDPSGKSTVQAIRSVIKNAKTGGELAVVVDQLPRYAESLGFPTDFIESEIAAKVPELGAAMADLRNAERDAQVAKFDLNAIKTGIENFSPPT
jgi:hypothetical protein